MTRLLLFIQRMLAHMPQVWFCCVWRVYLNVNGRCCVLDVLRAQYGLDVSDGYIYSRINCFTVYTTDACTSALGAVLLDLVCFQLYVKCRCCVLVVLRAQYSLDVFGSYIYSRFNCTVYTTDACINGLSAVLLCLVCSYLQSSYALVILGRQCGLNVPSSYLLMLGLLMVMRQMSRCTRCIFTRTCIVRVV